MSIGSDASTLLGIILILAVTSAPTPAENSTTLTLVNVLFRHGDRTPETTGAESYPTDPYRCENFGPFGPGELTNAGKKRSFAFGETLREKYGQYLGNVYVPAAVHARTTDVRRAKMSLLLVLAALFPPAPSQRWHESLMWQPVPYDYACLSNDQLLMPFFCPTYLEEHRRAVNSVESKRAFAEYDQLKQNLTKITGRNLTTMNDLYHLYGTFYAESTMGLDLPSWTREYYPEGKLRRAILLHLHSMNSNVALIRRNGGKLLRQIIGNMNRPGNSASPQGKIYLYSGHDVNVFSLYRALGFTDSYIPEFSSALIVELRSNGREPFVKVQRYLGIPATLEDLRIPGCEVLCPFDRFVSLTDTVIPRGEELKCFFDDRD